MKVSLYQAFYHGTTDTIYKFNKYFKDIFALEKEIDLSVLIEWAAVEAEQKLIDGKDNPIILVVPRRVVEDKTRIFKNELKTYIPSLSPEEYFPLQPRIITRLYERDAVKRLERFLSSFPLDALPRAFWPSNTFL